MRIILLLLSLFVLLSITQAVVHTGNWLWYHHEDNDSTLREINNYGAQCPTKVLTTTLIKNGKKWRTFNSSNNKKYLQNITMAADGVSFSGKGALYDNNVLQGWTNVKGKFYNDFSFYADYSARENPYFHGSREYYVLVTCTSSVEFENANQISTFDYRKIFTNY